MTLSKTKLFEITTLRMVHKTSLLNEAEVDVNNYAGRKECYWPRWITASEISIILHIIRKPNSIIVLLFIQNIS